MTLIRLRSAVNSKGKLCKCSTGGKMDEVIYMRFSGFYAFLRMRVPPIIAYDREIARSHL